MIAYNWDRPPKPWERRGLIVIFIVLLVGAAFVRSALAEPAIIGRASVIDGDTIEIASERIRFNGIDAPEGSQTCDDAFGRPYRCGTVSANALDEFLAASRPTRCDFVERDRYDRFVGVCYRQNGDDVAAWLVRNGHAVDWPRYSKGAYAEQQSIAERAGRGMWRGTFIPPWEWRRR